jgi:hypothetical protein
VNDNNTRNRALTGLAAAFVVTVASWFFIDHQTDRGLARLQLMDQVWKVCQTSYAEARTGADTERVDLLGLSAAVDSGKEGAPRRCGDMRQPAEAQSARDSARTSQQFREMIPTRGQH